MNWLIFVYSDNEIADVELGAGQTATVGAGRSDTLRLTQNGLEAGQLTLTAIETGVHLSALRPVSVGERHATNRVLAAGDIVRVAPGLALTVFERRCDVAGPVSLSKSEITIGRSGKKDISLFGAQVSSDHATLRRRNDGWELSDDNSRNGTFVNGKRISRVILRDNAVIFIGGWKLRYADGMLHFLNTPGSAAPAGKLSFAEAHAGARAAAYPYFQKSPRLAPEAKKLETEIGTPPRLGEKPAVSWLTILLPPIMMAFVMVVAVQFTGFGINTLWFTIPMSLISVVTSVVNYNAQTKKWKTASQTARDKYARYLKEREAEITAAETAYITALDAVNPSPDKCAGIAARRERRLWERSVSDADFLTVRIGTGTAESNVSVKLPQAQFDAEDNPLLAEAYKLKARHETLSGVPIVLPLADAKVVGIAGNRNDIQKVVWTMICGIAAHHSHEDVKIAVVFPERERTRWDFLRWLPHVQSEDGRARLLARSQEEAAKLLRGLDDELKVRSRRSDEKTQRAAPHRLIVLADKELVESAGVSLLPDDPNLGATVVYAYGDIGSLPGECGILVECGENAGTVYDKYSGFGRTAFAFDKISAQMMDAFARSLAPVRFRATSKKSSMPEYVPLLAGFEADRVEELDVLGRWSGNRPFESLAAPIGIRENGEVFAFDIHEKGMGPHGIVAGATRWGKSETLTTWLLSVALNYHPREVSFVLIDFKGDGLSGILMDLPHVAGKISNVNDIDSIERNLRSLQGELLRRQRVFMDTKQENIHKYQQAYRNGRVREPMPYLIIVIDEFAELKTQFPERMDNFIQIARVGGSLGVYMVLATQSPGGGIVSGQVSANSRFRICLKTAEAGESKDIIGTTDAFRITVRGRAYVKVGNNEVYEQVQTFFSKAPYTPGAGKSAATKINIVELDGSRIRPEVYDKTVAAAGADFGEGLAVANRIKTAAAEAGVKPARQVWTEALPSRIALSDLLSGGKAFENGVWNAVNDGLSVVAGLVDDPDEQRQYPLVLNFGENGHHVVYGAPQSGKTEFLRTALLSAAHSHTPEQLRLVVLEFGAAVMRPFERLPHTLLVADGSDREKISRAEQFLTQRLESRKRRFSEQGVGTLDAYRDITGEPEPAILIAVDNMASLYNMYPDFLDMLTVVAREGAGFGLYLLMTAGSQGSFMYRIAQYVKCSYALRLTDKADYRQIVGGNGKSEPGDFPGRGFAKGPLEFQTALFSDAEKEAERVSRLRETCAAMREAWRGGEDESDMVRAAFGEFDESELIFDGDFVRPGFDKRSGKAFDFVFERMNGCVVTGAAGSGKSNVLSWIVTALSRDANSELCIYEKGNALGSLAEGARVARAGAEFDEFAAELDETYRARAGGGAGLPRIAVVIDDFVKFYEEITDETADRLDAILADGAERGIFFFMAGDRDGLQRFANLSVKTFSLFLEKGNAVALGGRLHDYGMLNALHDADDASALAYEGFVISGRAAVAVKFAKARRPDANA